MSQAGRRGVGHLRRRDPRAGGDGRGPGVPGDGPAGRGRRRRPRCRRRCSSPSPTCSTSRSTCCSSTPPRTYFERDTEEDRRGRVPPVRALQGPPPRPAADRDRAGRHPGGHPGAVWCWPGNTNDQAVLPEVKDDLRDWRLGRVVTVVDRGFSSADEPGLPAPRRRALHRRRADARRQPADVEQALSRQGRYQQVRDNLRVKEVRLDDAPTCGASSATTPSEAERDRTRSATTPSTRIAAELDRIADGPRPARPSKQHRAATAATQRRGRAREGRVRAARPPHPRPLAAPAAPPGGSSSTAPRSRAEDRLDGKYLLVHLRPRPAAPRTSRWATRTCSRPNAASAT